MKKNLLFALSVFLITIIGLLVFCESSAKNNQESFNTEISSQQTDEANLASIKR